MYKSTQSNQGKLYTNEGYYEAIIQLRPKNSKVLEFALDEIIKSKALISKELELKEGYDLYITSRKIAVQIIKSLKRKFHGETRVSKKLYGVNHLTSKKVYRVTALFRLK